MQKSRRLIILLTHQLINCKEPAYDQHIALYNALIQNDTKVILLEMETIGTYEKLQESLRFIIKQQGTIKWREQHTVHPQSSNSKFWKQVRYHMPLTPKSSYSANAGWTVSLRKYWYAIRMNHVPAASFPCSRHMILQSGSLAVFLNIFQSFSWITRR